MRDSVPIDERQRFIDTIKQLGNNAILTQIHDDGHQDALFVSAGYIAMMMEQSEDEAMRYNGTGDFSEIIYPEDRPLVEYMLKHHHAPDKSHHLQIRKITAQHNIIWCDVHYAFIHLDSGNYLYLTFNDITRFKNYEEKIRTSYDSIGQTFYHQDEYTFCPLSLAKRSRPLASSRTSSVKSTRNMLKVYSS